MDNIKESLILIKRNKAVFSVIFALQVLFFVIVAAAGTIYIGKIIESSRSMLDYAESINLNQEDVQLSMMVQQNAFGDDPLLISRNYDDIIMNFLVFISIIFASFVLINGLMWYFASAIGNKKVFSLKKIGPYLLKFSVISVIAFSAFSVLLYSSMRFFFSGFLSSSQKKPLLLLILLPVLLYFIYVSMPLIGNAKFRQLPKKALNAGKNMGILASCAVSLFAIAASSLLVFYSVDSGLPLLLASVIFFFFVFSWGKVYFSIAVRKSGSL